MIDRIATFSESLSVRYPLYHKIGRFLLSGGLSTSVNLFLLYSLTEWIGIWYLFSAIIAFVIAFFISFTLQKFWTFKDVSRERIHFQAGLFLLIALVNLGVNTACLYYLVEQAQLHYLIAQIVVSAFIAVANYFIYQRIIFRP